ncbi:hypothetical protein [Paenibacillus sp. DMB5]|uniref:hypothetical protein n=1 Tax=Paenibacillus sp. DMB5 TaxID=1780103 RepID=UPI001F51EB00|nr:hypothetical protein [Paenibacillus sp. DMB5]
MCNLPTFTHISKKVAHELWSIVGSYHWAFAVIRTVRVHGSPKRLTGMLRLTRRSSVVADDDTGKYIDNAKDEEMPVATRDVTIFNVHLPELVTSVDDSVLWQLSGMLEALLTLWLQDI